MTAKLTTYTLCLFAIFLVPVFVVSTLSGVVSADTVTEVHNGVVGAGGGSKESGTTTVVNLISTVVNILLFLVGSFAVIMIVIAGFRLVTANGDTNTVSQAKNTIIYAVIGIVVAIMAWGIVRFITGIFT